MIYLLRVPTSVVIGTSLFQIVFVMAVTTLLQAMQNKAVDVVLPWCSFLAASSVRNSAQRPADG